MMHKTPLAYEYRKTCSFYLGSCRQAPRCNFASSVVKLVSKAGGETSHRPHPQLDFALPCLPLPALSRCLRSLLGAPFDTAHAGGSWMSRDPLRGGVAPHPSRRSTPLPEPRAGSCSASEGSPSAACPRKTSYGSRAVEWPS